MARQPLETDKTISRIEAEYSSSGLFTRFAHGRIKGFIERQLMTATGCAAVGFFLGPQWAIGVALLIFLGEGVEIAALKLWLRKLAGGTDVRKILRWSAFVGTFQALTLSLVFAIGWFGPSETDTVFLATAYLSLAAMNAGVVKSLHPSAATAKLTVYALTGAVCFGVDVLIVSGFSAEMAFNLMAAITLAYMVKVFVEYAAKNFKRNRQSARDLLRRQKVVELGALELHEKQKELRMLSMVARHANDAVVLSDPQSRITWVNDAFTRMSGYSYSDAIGNTPSDLLNSPNTDAEVVAALGRAKKSGKPFRGELINRRKDGKEIWVETNVVPVVNETGGIDMVVAVERDITQAKLHEHELAVARRDAERGDRAKSEFLATMSHEIRTPMNGVIGMADLLCESSLDEEQSTYATTIRNSAQALLKIINDILDFSKLDAGKLTLDPVDFAPGTCILDAIDILRPHAQEKGLYLDVSFDSRLPRQVRGDDGRLRQILINLVGNAIKFTDRGGVSLAVRHEEVENGVRLSIDVRDTGIGIDAEKISDIFDHFSQVDAATTRKYGGTGLGLSISRLLARQMGGDISALSRKEEGSVFSVTLVFEQALGDEQAIRTENDAVDPRQLSGMRVLLAEDNRTNRMLVERYLQKSPLEITSVENGREAVTAAQSEDFDVILMDMSMPVMDGLEATRTIREKLSGGPQIVALTANAFASDRQACLEAGMDDFLSKPVRKIDLLNALVRARERAGEAPFARNRA